MNYKDLGRRIRSLRQKQHLTQEQLAEKIDMSASFLGHIERGSRVASLETLVKICNVLDTNPGYLLAASLTCDASYMPTGLTPEVKEQLCTLLFLAHEVVMNMPTDPVQNLPARPVTACIGSATMTLYMVDQDD